MKSRQIDLLIIALIGVMMLLFNGCKVTPPVATNDSNSYREVVKDTVTVFKPDLSLAKYLLECEKTNEGYKVRIVQLLMQQSGEYLQTPVSTIDSNVLTTRAYLPEREIKWQVKRFYYSAVKSQTYVKITNVLTGIQWFWVWMGRIFAGIIVLTTGLWAVKRYTGFKIPFIK